MPKETGRQERRPKLVVGDLEAGARPFRDRDEAGRQLGAKLREQVPAVAVVLAVPRGGVEIGAALAADLGVPLGLALARRLPLPEDHKASFGAVDVDGAVVVDPDVVLRSRMDGEELDRIVRRAHGELLWQRRHCTPEGALPLPKGACALIADDGAISGYTLLAALRYARRLGVSRAVLASPVASEAAVGLWADEADELHVLHVIEAKPLDLAAHYLDFSPVSDERVASLLYQHARPGAPSQPVE